ncbi:hypothetical protein KR222_007395, partial [Zaprionus bogoriensis]
VLLIKRTERTSYALNHCVFPGGVFDGNADESPDWLTYFHSCGVTASQLELLRCRQTRGRPELLSQGQHFSRDISLRLTALREAFEEVGLLLCRPLDSLEELATGQLSAVAQLAPRQFDREEWQQRVHNDARQFLELCRQLRVLPDLWALSEWSVWRTPASASRRYDTVYYFAALETWQVPLLLEPSEVASAHWLHPADCWRHSQSSVIWLPFMLLYETARLMNLRSWQQLLQFARQRSAKGSTLLQPIYYRSSDCLFGVLPGDELYLDDPGSCTDSIVLSESMESINRRAKRYNRYMIYGFHSVDLASNQPHLDGHLQLDSLVNTRLSKL